MTSNFENLRKLYILNEREKGREGEITLNSI